MKDDNVGVTFVNVLLARGAYNNVVNLTFGTFMFTPSKDNSVDSDMRVSLRLRMDLECAKNLHDTLGKLLLEVEQGPLETDEEIPAGARPN